MNGLTHGARSAMNCISTKINGTRRTSGCSKLNYSVTAATRCTVRREHIFMCRITKFPTSARLHAKTTTTGNRAIVAMWLAALPVAGFGQVKADEPIKTTLCELVTEPGRFNGRIVSVQSRVLIDLEAFELLVFGCDGKKIDAVGLGYGEGPKRQPTTAW